MKDLLDENGCGHIRIFGGGGGTILPREVEEASRVWHHADLFTGRWKENGIGRDDRRPDQELRFPLNGNPEHFKGEQKLGE